jgi:hypothetical protein
MYSCKTVALANATTEFRIKAKNLQAGLLTEFPNCGQDLHNQVDM